MVGLEMDIGGPKERVFLVLYWVTLILLPTSKWLWAIPGPIIFTSYHFFLCLLFALFSYSFSNSFIYSSNHPPFSSFLEVTHVHVERNLQDGKEGWGGWKYSNSAGDHFQAQAVGQ